MKCFIPKTSRERDGDTLQFFLHKIPIPYFTTEALLRQSAVDMVSLLSSAPSITPALQYGDATQNALLQIVILLNRDVEISKLPSAPANPVPLLRVQISPSPVIQTPAAAAPRVQFSYPVTTAVLPTVQQPSTSSLKSSVPTSVQKPVPFTQYPPMAPTAKFPLKPARHPSPIPHQRNRFQTSPGTRFRQFALCCPKSEITDGVKSYLQRQR